MEWTLGGNPRCTQSCPEACTSTILQLLMLSSVEHDADDDEHDVDYVSSQVRR